MERRQFLAVAGSAAASMALAGCGTDDEPDDESSGDTGNGNGGDGGDSSSGSTNGGNSSNTTTDGGNGGDSGGGGLEIVEDEFYEDEFSAGVRGVVANNSDSEIGYVGVQAEFLNADGTRVGEGLDNTTDLAGGQQWEFDAVALDADPGEIDSYNISVSDSPF